MKSQQVMIMYRILFIFILGFGIQSCSTNTVVMNREVDTLEEGKMLLGNQSLSQFQKEPYSTWYNQEKESFTPNAELIASLKKEKLNSFSITVFLGTWCSDSHREFPRLVKILEASQYPMDKLAIIGVNRKKETPSGDETFYAIHRVPTIIIKKYGKEVGRIIETPRSGSLEKDILQIISQSNTSLKTLF